MTFFVCLCCKSRLANSWHESCCFPRDPMPMADITNGTAALFPQSPNRASSSPEQNAAAQDGSCPARRGPVPCLSYSGWLRNQASLQTMAITPLSEAIHMRNNVPPKQRKYFPSIICTLRSISTYLNYSTDKARCCYGSPPHSSLNICLIRPSLHTG